jgi:predicted transglutaminase-like protease
MAEVHSFFAALLIQSRLNTDSRVSVMVVKFSRRPAAEKISPCELIFGWLFKSVSNHPLPDLCIDKITKVCTGVHVHSALHNNMQATIFHHKPEFSPISSLQKKVIVLYEEQFMRRCQKGFDGCTCQKC